MLTPIVGTLLVSSKFKKKKKYFLKYLQTIAQHAYITNSSTDSVRLLIATKKQLIFEV
jgi:hypothetical protein